VIELDVDSNIYHVVYNPNPDFEFLFSNSTYWDLIRSLTRELVHPEDTAVLSRHPHRSIEALLRNGERKRTFRYRILTPSKGIYTPYEVTLLRVETGNPEQRILLTILHRLPEHQALLSGPHRPPEDPSTADLTCPLLRCLMDDKFTIQHGVKGLYPLTGFRPEEIVLQFSSSLLAMVVPQDRPALLNSVREAARHGTKSEAEYRLLSKNGSPIWVLGKTRLLTGSDGQEYYYHSLTNISTSKEKQKKLEATAHREHLLLELSEAVTFEWDLLADRVTCSHRWEERFGYPPMTVDFSNQLSVASHFHPDDLAQVREKLYDLLHGTTSITVDVRIANQQGKYLWNQIRATTLTDLYGKPERIIGTITDVDELKRMALQMRQRADQDALTHLLNKASAQRYVSSYLSACPPGEKAGFLILDLDNFKLVNDRYGHMYGDALLTQLGYTLRKLFRSQDLIGRVGGDEFIVLLKNIPHASLLLTRCSLLVSELRELLKKLMPELNVTCSIGCAIYPDHGQTYAELFQHADRALYAAKSQGKDQYILYDPLALYPSQADQPLPSRVDSDEEPTLNDASLTRYVFSRLYESRDIYTTIDELLAFIGAHFNVSRAYIFENNEDNTTCANTFEWCNVGISPEKEHLQCLSYADDLPNLRSLYNEREVFYVSDISTLPRPMRAVLEPQGIKSMLHCAILDAGVFRGYVGFDACADNRLWTEVQVETLEFLAKALSAFLLKQRTAEKTAKAMQDGQEKENN
jgi:putative two-component system response regulator